MTNKFLRQSNINYRQYLSELHKSFGISSQTLKEIIEEGTGDLPIRTKRITNGESNEIYDVTLSNHEQIIIKIARPRKHLNKELLNDFTKEQWVSEQCLIQNLPVAKVHFLKTYKDRKEVFSVCIQEKLEGDALNDLLVDEAIHKPDLGKVAIELGGLSSIIHTIHTTGFGDIDGYGDGEYDTWAEFILEPYRQRDRLYEVADKLRLGRDAVDSAFDILQEHTYLYDTVEPKLLYGDFNPRNVLVKNLQITGLIDFEHSLSGDPIYDLSRWDYFYVFHEFDTSLLIDQYRNKDIFGGSFLTKFHLYKLRFGLDILEYFDRKENPLGLQVAKNNFETDMRYFRSYASQNTSALINAELYEQV
jgi:aminoglycoside phosphotransferase (APT) family kinase protein